LEVREVRGRPHAGAAAAQVDSHHPAEEAQGGMRGLTVNLSRKAQGRVGLALKLHRSLREPNLLNPTGKAAAIPVAVPRALPATVEREQGRVVIYGPESLRVNAEEARGLRPVSHAEAVANMPSLQGRAERPVLAFAYSDEDVKLTLSAERRAPHITVRQLLLTRIESGVVKYEATFMYDILYSGVKSLRIDVPKATAGKIRITTSNIRRTVLDDADEARDPAEGAVAWRLEGETEFMGHRGIHMRWEEKIEKLDVGKSVRLEVPRLVPRQVDRAWGQIVLAKAEAIDVAPGDDRQGLRPIDPRHDLMPGAGIKDAARAFEFHDEWALAVNATRYEPKDVKATSIERGLVRMVITRSDVTSVQALYRMRSARQRLVVNLPGEVKFDTQPVRINGRPVTLEQGEAGEYFVPLVSQKQDESFLLELRYVITGSGMTLIGPGFPKEPAIQKVYLSAFIPKEQVYLGAGGPWDDEIVWVLRGFNTWPRGNKNSNTLLAWVTEGLNVDRGSLGNFATDGRHVLFSTLRPAAGEEGALRIRTVRRRVLQTLLLAIIIGLGAALLSASFARRAFAAGAALIVVVVLAVFTPALARAVVNNATVAAGFIVLIVWILWFLLVTFPRSPAYLERKRARAAARALKYVPPPLPEGPGESEPGQAQGRRAGDSSPPAAEPQDNRQKGGESNDK
jgi:hypothetical protein